MMYKWPATQQPASESGAAAPLRTSEIKPERGSSCQRGNFSSGGSQPKLKRGFNAHLAADDADGQRAERPDRTGGFEMPAR